MDNSSFQFACVRYVPDVVSGEFVNVGLVLHCPSRNLLVGRFVEGASRVSRTFPGFNTSLFRVMTEHFRDAVGEEARKLRETDRPAEAQGFPSILDQILVRDDSSFQWGPIGCGFTSNPQAEFAHLYSRLVEKESKTPSTSSRTEREVWQTFAKAIDRSKHRGRFQPYKPASPHLHPFEHTIRNGSIHVFEPINFNLGRASAIREKALHWVGAGDILEKNDSAVGKLYFLVSDAPENGNREVYEGALRILEETRIAHLILPESEAERLVEIVDDIIDRAQ